MRIDDLVVMMTLTPGRAGYNELNVMYFDVNGGEGELGGIMFAFSYLDYGNIHFEHPPTERHTGHAVLTGEHFRHAGHWRLQR